MGGLEIGEHQEEIEELDAKYKVALKNKVEVYEELVECLKELTQRQNKYHTNEMVICKMANQVTILKKQLE